MHLNSAGLMIDRWWRKIPDKFPHVTIDAQIVMPNHYHAIITIPVGADPSVCPNPELTPPTDPIHPIAGIIALGERAASGEHVGSPLLAVSLGRMVQWAKTMTTNEYIRGVKRGEWQPFHKRLWQRNYYEHIIRDEKALTNIRNYIADNPARWNRDQLHPQNPSKY